MVLWACALVLQSNQVTKGLQCLSGIDIVHGILEAIDSCFEFSIYSITAGSRLGIIKVNVFINDPGPLCGGISIHQVSLLVRIPPQRLATEVLLRSADISALAMFCRGLHGPEALCAFRAWCYCLPVYP